MKIYAKQVSPEYQESPLFLGDEFFPDNIAVSGAWRGGKAFHRVKVQYTRKGAAFFVVHGYRIPLDECIRMGV